MRNYKLQLLPWDTVVVFGVEEEEDSRTDVGQIHANVPGQHLSATCGPWKAANQPTCPRVINVFRLGSLGSLGCPVKWQLIPESLICREWEGGPEAGSVAWKLSSQEGDQDV